MAERFSLPPVAEAIGPLGGIVNRSYLLALEDGSRWICRINANESDSPKIVREERIYRWLWERGTDLPIARRYLSDTSRTILPCDYALLPALPGKRVGSSIEEMDRPDRNLLLTDIGRLLRVVHSLPAQGFGDLIGSTSEPNWRTFLSRSFETLLGHYREILGYSPAWEAEVSRRFDEWLREVPESPAPVFLHGDYHYDNLLFTRDHGEAIRISGLFDLEWAWAGEAGFDLLHLEEAFALYPEDEPHFLEGYGESSLHSERLRVYRLLHILRLLSVGLSFQPEPLWDLVARQEAILKNLLRNKKPFEGL
ncbi:MAG TPA: aminoglycoside phosphotransferase family protein [Nitrospiria bacterium]|nr:aminoglycoside phosphotransferase family protein [Nitrospiria bacterium]